MKNRFILLLSYILIGCINGLDAQSKIVGTWYNVDDEDGKPKSHIQIYERDGKLEGKVIKLLPAATTTHCNSCSGTNKGKSIKDMVILWGLQKDTEVVFEDGEILDPKNGKIYSCDVVLENPDKLKVRGYIGFSLLGRTQYWYRLK